MVGPSPVAARPGVVPVPVSWWGAVIVGAMLVALRLAGVISPGGMMGIRCAVRHCLDGSCTLCNRRAGWC